MIRSAAFMLILLTAMDATAQGIVMNEQIDPASGNSAALHSSSALAFVIRQVLIESLP